MASKLNTVEGVTPSGTTITNVNSGGASGDAWQSTSSTGATLASDNTHAAHGSLSMKIATTTSATSFVTWTLTASATWWFRLYFWVDSITAATNPALMRFRGTTDTVQAIRVTFDATGHMQIRNTSNAVAATMTAAFTLSQWNRLEGFCTPGNGTTTGAAEVKLFVGDNTTPVTNGTLSTTGQNFGSVTNIDAVSFGQVVAFASLPAEWLDDLTVSNVNYPGPQVQTLSPASIASAESVPTPTITPGRVTISMPSIASAQSVPTPTITPGSVTLHPPSIGSAEAFGTPALTPGAVTLHPPSIPSGESFGTPLMLPGAVILHPPSIPSAESVPTPSITPSPLTIHPPSIPSGESFGTPSIVGGPITLFPATIPSDESFGTPSLVPSPITLRPATIPSGEDFGIPTIFEPGGTIVIHMPSIESEESFGPIIAARISPSHGACCTGEEFRRDCCADSIADAEEEI